MKQGFVSLYGRITIERDVLYFRSPYLPFEKTAFVQIGFECLCIAAFIIRLVSADKPMDNFMTIVFGVLVLSRFPDMYDKFFRTSYASRIPLSAIQYFTLEDDPHGIQTEIKLHLKNGRYKTIVFRKLENQLEPFVALLSANNAHLAPA